MKRGPYKGSKRWYFEKSFDKERFTKCVEESISVSEVLRKYGEKEKLYKIIQEKIIELDLDFTHFLGKGHNITGRHTGNYRKEPWADFLILNTKGFKRKTHIIKRALLEIGVKHECSECGLKQTWSKKKLALQLDHINGKSNDDRRENLRFLCPNCHSQTDTYYGRNIGNYEQGKIYEC